jgi:hypothetical protein
MARWAVIEQSTDLRYPHTRVRWYRSLRRALTDAAQGAGTRTRILSRRRTGTARSGRYTNCRLAGDVRVCGP